MAVYVDDMFFQASVPNGLRTVTSSWCHLTADTEEELHRIAHKIGLKRSWFQEPKLFPDNADTRAAGVAGQVLRPGHYDVTLRKRDAAVRAGAIPVRMGTEPWRARCHAVWERWMEYRRLKRESSDGEPRARPEPEPRGTGGPAAPGGRRRPLHRPPTT